MAIYDINEWCPFCGCKSVKYDDETSNKCCTICDSVYIACETGDQKREEFK